MLNILSFHVCTYLGTFDEKAYMHFLDGALTVMKGKTYIPSGKSNPGTSFLPSIAGADTQTTVKDVAVDLPMNRQQELLGRLKLVEAKIAPPSSNNPLAKDMRIPNKAKIPRKRFGAPQGQSNTMMVAIGHLSRARQIQLLGSLRNLEDRLKLSTAQTLVGLESGFENVDMMPPQQPTLEKVMVHGPYGPEMKLRPIKKIGDDAARVEKKGPRITYAQVSQTLRRLGKAMTTDTFKIAKYNLNSRENKDVVGHGSIGERVMQLLNIRLSKRDIQIIMSRFDREGNETVDLVDVLGNAKLYYSRSVHEENIRAEEKLRRASSYKLAKANRIARMEEKSQINRMLVNKIDELETNIDGIDDDTTLDSYSFLQDSYVGNDSVNDDVSTSELDKDLDGIRDFAYNAMRSKKMRYLDAVANKINQDQFREVLYIFGINSKDTIQMLQRLYATSMLGVIDAKSFKHDFKALALHENHKRKQIGAVSSFYKALSSEQQNTSKALNQYIVPEKGPFGDTRLNLEAMRDRQNVIANIEQNTVDIIMKNEKADISRLDDNVESASHRSGGVREENVRKGNANSLAAVSDTPRESHKEENLRAGAECKDDDAEELDVDATDALRLTKNLTETVLNAEAGHEEEGSYADSYGDDEYEDYEEEDDMM